MFSNRCKSFGITLIEIIISISILAVVFTSAFLAFRTFNSKASQNLSKKLVLQLEARKALTDLYRTIQDGIEVIAPLPGLTLPYLTYRDVVNNIRMVYLEKDKNLSKKEGKTIYRAMMITKDPNGIIVKKAKCFMRHILSLNFTSYSPGAVLITADMYAGRASFSLINFIRLQNVSSENN